MSNVEGRNIDYSMGMQNQPRAAWDGDREKRRLVEQQRMGSSYARGENGSQGVAPYQEVADVDKGELDIARRYSSLGATLLTEFGMSATVETSLRSEIPRPGKVFMPGLSGEQTCEPPFRPMVGGGAAAAYNALRFDFYMQKQKAAKQKRRMSSLSMGSAKLNTVSCFNSCGTNKNSYKGNMNDRRGGASIEEQYEMLKLHHLNLMNEIQETALMLNLYEQQQLAREQQEELRRMQQARLLANNQATTGQSSAQAETKPDDIQPNDRNDKKRISSKNCDLPKKRQK